MMYDNKSEIDNETPPSNNNNSSKNRHIGEPSSSSQSISDGDEYILSPRSIGEISSSPPQSIDNSEDYILYPSLVCKKRGDSSSSPGQSIDNSEDYVLYPSLVCKKRGYPQHIKCSIKPSLPRNLCQPKIYEEINASDEIMKYYHQMINREIDRIAAKGIQSTPAVN